jgi:hypothetical protein
MYSKMPFSKMISVVLRATPLVCFALLLYADDAPVGLVSMVKGAVQIQRAGQKTPVAAKMADLVGPGDRLITGAGGEAVFIYCPDARSARLQAAGEVTFSASALQVIKGKLADDHKIAGCRLPTTLALSSASQQAVGMVKTRGLEMRLRAPVEGVFISEARPKFAWEPVPEATRYDVRLQNREEEVLYKTTVTATEFQYPVDGPALEPGQKYWWRVSAVGKDGQMDVAGTFFQTLPANQVQTFRTSEADLKKQIAANPGDTGPRILLAFLYEENGMYDAAARLYDKLSKELSDNSWIKSRLYTMLEKLHWDKVE